MVKGSEYSSPFPKILALFFATFRCFGRNRNFLHFLKLPVLRNFSAKMCKEARWRRPSTVQAMVIAVIIKQMRYMFGHGGRRGGATGEMS